MLARLADSDAELADLYDLDNATNDRLLAENDLPMPDEVVHRPAEVVFLYHAQKLAFVFEIEAPH